MKPKWLIEPTGIIEDAEPLIDALDYNGIEYKEIHRDFVFRHNRDLHEIYGPDECVIFFGTLQLAHRVRKQAKWIPGVYYNVEAYNCINYYPHIGSLLLNRDYIMLPFGDLIRRQEFIYDTLGEARTIFLRPNRGDKTFTGHLLYKEHFVQEVERLKCYNYINDHEIVIVAKPVHILNEWRFVCIEGKVITGSSYKTNNVVGSEAVYTDEALEMANKVAKMYDPDIAWIIDIGQTKERYCVVEVGCFSCAGLYKCDRNIIVEEVSKAALKEWESYR